jgi:hypothetical protein
LEVVLVSAFEAFCPRLIVLMAVVVAVVVVFDLTYL